MGGGGSGEGVVGMDGGIKGGVPGGGVMKGGGGVGGGGEGMGGTKGYTLENTLGKRKKARAAEFERREGDWVCPKCRQLIFCFANIPNTPIDIDQKH
jgi:hypothetical protein